MKAIKVSNILKGAALTALAGCLMGNQSCQKANTTPPRELRRRVQIGQLTAPAITLPSGGTFDFAGAANAQLETILANTSFFSNVNSAYNPSNLSTIDDSLFNTCNNTSTAAAAVSDHMAVQKDTITDDSSCMIGLPQALISGEVLGFDMTQSGGVQVSNIPIAAWGTVSAGFQASQSTLTLNMNAVDPLVQGLVLASTSAQSYQNATTVNLGLDILQLVNIGPSYYTQTDLSKVVSNGLTTAVTNLNTQLNADQAWYATVLRNCGTSILINAGGAADAGLEVGDVLEVHNVSYDWAGAVCSSELMGSLQESTVLALVQVTEVGDTFSMAEVINRDTQSTEKILPGARVLVNKLLQAGQKPAPLPGSTAATGTTSSN